MPAPLFPDFRQQLIGVWVKRDLFRSVQSLNLDSEEICIVEFTSYRMQLQPREWYVSLTQGHTAGNWGDVRPGTLLLSKFLFTIQFCLLSRTPDNVAESLVVEILNRDLQEIFTTSKHRSDGWEGRGVLVMWVGGFRPRASHVVMALCAYLGSKDVPSLNYLLSRTF